MASVNPYLGFDGNCEEAFEFYRSVFGGEFADLARFSDMPSGDSHPAPAGIMHVSLPLGDGQALMGSDRPPDTGGVTHGNAVAISVAPDGADEGGRIFAALASEGEVHMPYERQFWGADFGTCTDKYGFRWMVNYTPDH